MTLRPALLFAVLVLTAAPSAAAADAPHRVEKEASHAVRQDAVAPDIVARVNAFRRAQRLGEVAAEPHLAAAAQAFAQYLAQHDAFSHEADGREPPERAAAQGYAYCVVSENLGYEQRSPPLSGEELAALLVDGWERSPPHRRNMVDPDVTDTGVGLAQSRRTGRWYAVQMFGRPRSAAVVFQVSNATDGAVRYRVGDRAFELGPRVTNTHEQCRPTHVSLAGSGASSGRIELRGGEHYAIVREPSGELALRRE